MQVDTRRFEGVLLFLGKYISVFGTKTIGDIFWANSQLIEREELEIRQTLVEQVLLCYYLTKKDTKCYYLTKKDTKPPVILTATSGTDEEHEEKTWVNQGPYHSLSEIQFPHVLKVFTNLTSIPKLAVTVRALSHEAIHPNHWCMICKIQFDTRINIPFSYRSGVVFHLCCNVKSTFHRFMIACLHVQDIHYKRKILSLTVGIPPSPFPSFLTTPKGEAMFVCCLVRKISIINSLLTIVYGIFCEASKEEVTNVGVIVVLYTGYRMEICPHCLPLWGGVSFSIFLHFLAYLVPIFAIQHLGPRNFIPFPTTQDWQKTPGSFMFFFPVQSSNMAAYFPPANLFFYILMEFLPAHLSSLFHTYLSYFFLLLSMYKQICLYKTSHVIYFHFHLCCTSGEAHVDRQKLHMISMLNCRIGGDSMAGKQLCYKKHVLAASRVHGTTRIFHCTA
ncbi:hypothetical protein VP01_5247g1 [Puccinia sorghi]|uniref:Uncharacterized protein n=1 Tax=Puccinia sorghi TaxID=27349 RepID=A0A0L6UKJ0_9BASI|nr:hypothetical protein VP01_5247g1 [Puccinia sorghi]